MIGAVQLDACAGKTRVDKIFLSPVADTVFAGSRPQRIANTRWLCARDSMVMPAVCNGGQPGVGRAKTCCRPGRIRCRLGAAARKCSNGRTGSKTCSRTSWARINIEQAQSRGVLWSQISRRSSSRIVEPVTRSAGPVKTFLIDSNAGYGLGSCFLHDDHQAALSTADVQERPFVGETHEDKTRTISRPRSMRYACIDDRCRHLFRRSLESRTDRSSREIARIVGRRLRRR